ncbi:MAG: DNA adenine methylase [Bacteroidia bacterium]
MKTPISYYGGKQRLVKTILPLIPKHTLYCEPFCGGAAIFFSKESSTVEVINDTNRELINFYWIVQQDFPSLEKLVKATLHSRSLFNDAKVVYENSHMFDPIKRAWAVWVLSVMGFASILNSSFGYDKSANTTTKKITSKRERFTEELAQRLQNVQIECTDALRIIRSRDTKDSFFYCDPPYYNSNCAHYDGYSLEDFESLLKTLSQIEGKFLLSSYPSDILKKYIKEFGWYTREIEQIVTVGNNHRKTPKTKREVLTSNYAQ